MITKIVIVRHGNTFEKGDVIRRVGAGTDIPLTAEGLAQADRAGQHLKAYGLSPTAIFASPLARTMQTAGRIQSVCTPDVTVQEAEFLKELHFGPDDGLPETAVLRRLGMRLLGEHETDAQKLEEAGEMCLRRWSREYVVPPGWAVDVEACFRRWREFAVTVLREYAGQTVLAVTSNGTARFAWGILPLPSDGTPPGADKKMATGAVSVFTHDGTAWHCETWGFRPAP